MHVRGDHKSQPFFFPWAELSESAFMVQKKYLKIYKRKKYIYCPQQRVNSFNF